MQSILNNVARIGNATSSEIVALTTNGTTKGSFGKPFYTYLEECNMERKLNRSLSNESNAHALTWGKLVEEVVFDLLPLEYCICSNDTFEHKTIKCWSGSPDAKKNKPKTVCDVKSPLTLKSFCQFVDCIPMIEIDGIWQPDKNINGNIIINRIRKNHKDGEKYYWQLVSNAILTDSVYAELIVYVPYLSELNIIKEAAKEKNEYKFNWIVNAESLELPYINDLNGTPYYKNLNIISFEVPQADKDFLTSRVLALEQKLIKF